MTLHSLPLFVQLAGRPVMLLGEGEAADAKRRLLERAGAAIVGEEASAALAIVAIAEVGEAVAAVARLKARGLLVNAVDRPDLCDFTVPAIVDRDPVIVAIGTGGVSAGLAAALRQRLEGWLPAGLGGLARALHAARAAMRARWPDAAERRRALGKALSEGGALDPIVSASDVGAWLGAENMRFAGEGRGARMELIVLISPDPDDLTLRQVRVLAQADRLYHTPAVPPAILNRARADAPRIVCVAPPVEPGEGLSVWLEMA